MRRLPVVVAFALAVSACDSPTSERIQTWKGTERGPEKIEAALGGASVPASLRAEAAAALVDLGRPEKVDAVMASLAAGERWEILKTLIELYVKGMSSPQVPKARDARDGLFSVRQYAPPEEQQRIDGILLASIEKDLFDGRFAGGRHSLDKMLSAIGVPSGPMLVRLLGDPKTPYRGLAELLVKVGDDAVRDKGGAALIGRITAGRDVPSDMWISLGLVGGPTVAQFLSNKIEKGSPEEAIAAAKAMQQSRFPGALTLAMRIASDPKANKELRGEAFGVIEKIGGPEALKGLLRIIAEDKNDIVRYRAHEAALEVGKADAILPALQAFSTKLSFKREDVVDFLVKDISKVGAKAKPQVIAALASPSALARMAAVLALEASLPANPKGHLGGPEDVAALAKLAGDLGTVRGFPPGMTIAAEAGRVSALLENKGK